MRWRAAGVSAWNLLAPPLTVAVVMGVFAVVAFTPLSSCNCWCSMPGMEAKYIRGQESRLAISRNGLWLRYRATSTPNP